MIERPQRNSVFDRFAERCNQRKEEIAVLVGALEQGKVGDALNGINLKIHDWIGEAKLLGFDKVAQSATSLADVVTSWGLRLHPSTHGAQLKIWADLLADISQRFALGSPDPAVLKALRGLNEELDRELHASRHERDVSTGDFPHVSTSRRILILDDSPIVGEALLMELEGKGHQVKLASTLAKFNQYLDSFDPEMIFLDINMPEMRGDEVCRRLRRRFETRDVPIIFLSSLEDDELAMLAERAGASGYLSKQHGMEELLQYLDRLLSEIIF